METTFQKYIKIVEESKNYHEYDYIYDEGETYDQFVKFMQAAVLAGTFALFPAFLAATLIVNGFSKVTTLTEKEFMVIKPQIEKFIKNTKDEKEIKKIEKYIIDNAKTLNPNIVTKTIKSVKGN